MSLLDFPRPVETYHSASYDRIAPSKAQFDGKGKTVLITAGATGVGRAMASSFAQAGVSRVIIVSRSVEPQQKAKKELEAEFPGLEVVCFEASITDNARVQEVLSSAGDVDVLILSAVYSHPHVPTLDILVSEIAATFDTNIMGNFNMLHAYLTRPVPALGSKTVINVSSCGAHINLPGKVGYGSSKAGFAHVLQHLAAEFTPGKDHIRMFNLHPGVFLTDAARGVGFDETSLDWEDIAIAGDFAVWLAGREGSFLAGRFVWAQWDVDELLKSKERVEKDPSFLTLGLVM